MVIARYCACHDARLPLLLFSRSIRSPIVRGYIRNVAKDVKDVPILTPLVTLRTDGRLTDYSAST